MAGTTKTLQRKNFKKPPIILSPPRRPSHQQISSSKRRERSRAKSYKDYEKLGKELEIKKNKKCNERSLREIDEEKQRVETPRKTKRILRGIQIKMKTNENKKRKSNVKRTSLFHFAMNLNNAMQ